MATKANSTTSKAKGTAKAKAKAPKGSATFTKPQPVAPANRRGNSTVANPVGVSWVLWLNATQANGGTPPARKALHQMAMAKGVAYHTARTQAQRFLQWHRNGANPAGLPKGVSIG